MSKQILFIIIMLFSAFMGRRSVILAAKARKNATGRKTSYTAFTVVTIVNALLGAILALPISPYVYFVLLIFLGFAQAINTEGELRRKSWNTLGVTYSILLALSVAEHFMNKLGGPQPWMGLFLIPMFVPFIVGTIKSIVGKNPKNDDSEGVNVISTIITVVIILMIIALMVLFITRRG